MQSYELASLQSYGLAIGFMGLVAGFLLGRWCGGRQRSVDETDSEDEDDCQSSSEEPLIYVSKRAPSVYHDGECHYVKGPTRYRKLRICKECKKQKETQIGNEKASSICAASRIGVTHRKP